MKKSFILWRFEDYNNSACVKRLPFEGKHYFACQTKHLVRLKKFIKAYDLGIDKFTFIKSTELKIDKIIMLNYNETNEYVLGGRNELPTQLDFDINDCCMKWVRIPELMHISDFEVESMGKTAYRPVLEYQLIIK